MAASSVEQQQQQQPPPSTAPTPPAQPSAAERAAKDTGDIEVSGGTKDRNSGDRSYGSPRDDDDDTPTAPNAAGSRPENPLANASFLSRLLFRWPHDLLKIGLRRTLVESDLPEILDEEDSARNLHWMEEMWAEATATTAGDADGKSCGCRFRRPGGKKVVGRKQKPKGLHRVIVEDFVKSLWYCQLMMAAGVAARIGQGITLGLLIEYFSVGGGPADEGYLWAGLMTLCATVVLFEHHHVFFATWRKGLQLKTASIAAIYSKSLRLSCLGRRDAASSGNVINLVTNDVERFLMAALFSSYLFWGPVYAVAVLVVGLVMIGPAFASGYALLAVFVPLQFYLSSRFGTLRSRIAKVTDARVNLVSQAVAGVRVMKMSGWEMQFDERISGIRDVESRKIQQANRLRALNEAVYFASSVVMSLVIFAVTVGTGGVLTPRLVFTCMTLVNVVQFELMKHFSLGVMSTSECYVSIRRIENFLAMPELPVLPPPADRSSKEEGTDVAADTFVDSSSMDGIETSVTNAQRPAMALKDVTCYWNLSALEGGSESTGSSSASSSVGATDDDGESSSADENVTALSEINLDINNGELTCIVGPVGSGKSALVLALAGELPCARGTIERNYSSVAYAAQDPWIMDGTVRENIVMDKEFRPDWYDAVVGACGLAVDFAQFPSGDKTIVGDRGVQCSGGQRARIGLARALYRDADVLLLDDPLSAVDAKVGRLIFHSAITELGVRRGKCVVLVTHQHQFVGDSKCVLMCKGKIACVGTYADCIIASRGTLRKSIQNASSIDLSKMDEDEEGTAARQGSAKEELDELADDSLMTDPIAVENETVHKERSEAGVVQMSTYTNYMKAMGGIWIALGLLLLFAMSQTSLLATITFVGEWADMSASSQSSPSTLGLMLGLGASVVILSIFRAISGYYFTIRASQRLHDNMLKSVLRAKIEFFDTNPLGRILNRFSADVGIIDDLLPATVYDLLASSFMVLGGAVTTIVVLPFILIVFPPVLYYFFHVRRTFLTTSRELKRMEGVARSPMFAMLSESLLGISTIRANDTIAFFRRKFEDAQNHHSRAFWAFIASSRWIGFRMDFIMWVMLIVASFMGVIVNEQGWLNINPSVFGLALMMLIQLAALFQWAVRQSAEVVNQMVSVERVVQFSNLDPEAPLTTEEDRKHASWPSQGCIEAKSLTVRYRSTLPPSLSGVSFSVQSGQRVGVVGRTGSGKSTLMQALFRILEAEDGSVFVDGVDISTLGLHKLRMQMSVIPQTPVLFSGCTIRENLDPFQDYTDTSISAALADVQMLRAVNELPGGLSSVLAEGGSNFSVGQRQLLCLARAILRRNKILVLDEPTANVDGRTDELLQDAVSKTFAGSTILAIAHRLDTVIDYDRILVLGGGRVLEFGTPRELLEKEGGHFALMVADTGEEMASCLRQRSLMNRNSECNNS